MEALYVFRVRPTFACVLTVYDQVHEEFVYVSYFVFRNNRFNEVSSCVDVVWFILST